MHMRKWTTQAATKLEIEKIDQKLGAFNQEALSFSGTPEMPIALVIKNDDDIIAGISGCIDWGYIFHLELLFVDEKYRHQGLGTLLVGEIEHKAKANGAGLVQTDTFDFQAKDFYLKHGYEIFGVIDDSPRPGHKRYYLKKDLR